MSQARASSPPPRVCHVFCGTEGATWMVEQLRELRRRYGYEVHALVSGSKGTLIDKLQAEKIPFHVSPFVFSVTQPYAIVRAILLMSRLLRRERFDVVQSHVFWSAFVARPAAWLADVPVRLAMIAGPYHLQAFSSRWVDRSTAWMETTVIPSCRKSLDLYLAMGIPARRLALIYYGADPAKFDPARTLPAGIRAEYGWPANTPVVALVAYFYTPQPKDTWTPRGLFWRGVKGQDLFIKAVPIVAAEFPNAKFLLVGNDWGATDYRQELDHLARELGLQDKLVFTGYRADVNRILRDVDVAVQVSRSENLGGTIEALLMECPVVATRVGGMPDTVRDHETGILANPSDPADIARGIIELLRNPEQARAWGRNGRILMLRGFSLDKTVDDLHALYTRLLASNPRRSRFFSWCVSARRMALSPLAAFYCAWGLAVIRRASAAKQKARNERARLNAEIERERQEAEIERERQEAEIEQAKQKAAVEQAGKKPAVERVAALKPIVEVECTATPKPAPPAKPPIHVSRATLIHCNQTGDIVSSENVTRLRLGGELPQNGLYLGVGWHGLERDEQGSFRWLRSGGEVIVSRPDGEEKHLVLDVQSGPSRLCRPFEIRLVNESDAVIGRAIVNSYRSDIAFLVRPGVDGVRFSLKAPPLGIPLPTDIRILNLCVRRISWKPLREDDDELSRYNSPEDIVPGERPDSLRGDRPPGSGILLGRGWHGLERDECGSFRRMHTEAEMIITVPAGSRKGILIDVEPGLSPADRLRELQLQDDRGTVVDCVKLSARQEVVFRLPPAASSRAVFRLVTPASGFTRMWNKTRTVFRLLASAASRDRPANTDTSVLNFRIRRISWAEDSGTAPRSVT
jgi:glycosyltransferase involved in cell wall biosynthesis